MLSREMVAAIAVIFVCSLAVGALVLGFALCWILRCQWSARTAAMDVLAAIGIATTCAVISAVLRVDTGRAPTWIAGLALLGVVLLHLARRLTARTRPERLPDGG